MGVKAAGGSTAGALRLVILAHAASLLVLLGVLGVRRAGMPHGAALAWGIAAGLAGGISLTAFYIALARGAMGASAAVSGLIAAAIPAVVSSGIEGTPGVLRLLGFALALAAIWMIAAGPAPENGPAGITGRRRTMALAVVGGIGFGFYFVALRMANSLGVLEPMALARAGSLLICMPLLLASRLARGRSPARESEAAEFAHRTRRSALRQMLAWAMGVAVLDTGGNLLFLAATRLGRLDVSAVLASLYPASTILLAAWRLHERPTRRQVAGMAVALLAVIAITV